MEPLLLKPAEAARRLGIGASKVNELMLSGKLESVKIGRSRRVPTDALDAYIESLREQSDAD